ncbi:DgyrCDS4889 [Dimorphilus gyrociliatus]|uniref:MICOS complex subunit MIC10 n=1 Tax=Dimorphilus gyrociliatus TaxID=2664684 RepID=A0A7I8VKI9_9ANNE|nr:DgyrCDS4889 [Dimorphilus gyrociliatus]
MASNIRSEDVLGRKWDRCLSDAGIKVAGGVGLGVVFSVIFFRRRPWPIIFGAGIGLGMAYSNCQHNFSNKSEILEKIAVKKPQN